MDTTDANLDGHPLAPSSYPPIAFPLPGSRRTGAPYPPSAAPLPLSETERHQASQNGPTADDPYYNLRVGVFPVDGARPAHVRGQVDPSLLAGYARHHPLSHISPSSSIPPAPVPLAGYGTAAVMSPEAPKTATAVDDVVAAFLAEMPTAQEDPTRHALWTELIQLKTRTLELQIAEARRKEKEAELELHKLREAVAQRASRSGDPAGPSTSHSVAANGSGSAGGLVDGGNAGASASASASAGAGAGGILNANEHVPGVHGVDPNHFQHYPFVTHARPPIEDNQQIDDPFGSSLPPVPAQVLPPAPTSSSSLALPPATGLAQTPMTPFDLEAMMQDANLDSMFDWLPDLDHGIQTPANMFPPTAVDPSSLLIPTLDRSHNELPSMPHQNDEFDFELGDTKPITEASPRKRRASSAETGESETPTPAKKTKKGTEKKIVEENQSVCVTCRKPVGRIMIRALKSQIPDKLSVDFKCLECAPVAQPPSLPDQAMGGSSSIGTVEMRKRIRVDMEIEDAEAGQVEPTKARRAFCDVCQRVVGSGSIVGGKEREPMGHMAEIVCASCDGKYQRCTDCGGGGGPRVGIGKWRMKQVFLPGRKTCSLSHSRLGDRPREIGVHIVPTDFTREQLKEVLARCKALWTEKTLARLAVPEMLEIDLPPHLMNPLRHYADVEDIVTRNWPTRESMVKAEGADPNRFKRVLGLTWAHSRPRRNVRTVDLEVGEYAKTVEAEEEEDNSTVLANVKRTSVVIPAGSELIGMWGGEWDMQQGSLLISTLIPFEGTDGEDSTALSVGEMITKVQSLQQSINAERTSVATKQGTEPALLPQVEHLWVVSGGTMPLVRERMADILIRKRSFVHVEEYLTRHPDFVHALHARPEGLHPDLHRPLRAHPEQDPDHKTQPLILVRWLGKDFDAQKILEIKQMEFGGKGKLRKRPRARF